MHGDKQEPYCDFDPDDLYAPVARHETIRMLLAKVAAQGLILEAADVANAYLYGDLSKPVTMEQPKDSSGVQQKPGHVALVVKSLYGHKAAGQIWGNVIHMTVVLRGFTQSTQDSRLYFLKLPTGIVILIIVVDDIALASNNPSLLEEVKLKLTQTFKVKLLGPLRCFIGWRSSAPLSGSSYTSANTSNRLSNR